MASEDQPADSSSQRSSLGEPSVAPPAAAATTATTVAPVTAAAAAAAADSAANVTKVTDVAEEAELTAKESGRSDARFRLEIDPKVLSEIEQLPLRARIIADAIAAGIHRSRNKGTSVEFAEHKEYSPGDNVRQLDWRAFARLDRDYVKQFEDEANLRVLMVIDASGSMGYPMTGARLSKLACAATCAGALAYVLVRQGDSVGVASFSEDLTMLAPAKARRGHLQEVLSVLDRLEARGPSRLRRAIDALSDGLPRKTMVIVFSDLLDGGLDALEAISLLRARRHDVVLFHVLDSDELDFPFEEHTRFESLEDDREIEIDPSAIRDAYREEMERFLRRATAACRAARVEYRLMRTDRSLGRLLAEFLTDRLRQKAIVR